MSNFLDKVGLQHVVEKIKGLLSGYLPLSGGTMTGAIKFGNMILGALSISEEGVKTSKIVNKNTRTATFNTNECNTGKFVLSLHPDATGLIANNSYTVIKEIDEMKATKIYYDSSVSSVKEGYLGVKALSAIYQALDLHNSLLQIITTKDIEISPYLQSVLGESEITIPVSANTTCCLRNDIWMLNDPESIKAIVAKGLLPYNLEGFSNLETFRSNGSYLQDLNAFRGAFKNCTKLTYVDVNDWNIDMASDLSSMFYNCSALSNITLNLWDTRNVTDTSNMFAQCYSLEKLDITGWDMTNVTNMADMFAGCSKIKNLLLSEGFGRMKDEVGTLDLSSLTLWTTESVQTLLTLYDRKANGLGVITIKLSSATKNALGASGIQTLTAKGYTIA